MKRNIIKIFCAILIICLLVIVIWNFVYSKYFNSKEVAISSRVANPKVYVQMEEQIVDNLNEEVILYEFSVKNYDETSSDTSFNYYISFDIGNAPLLIELYRIDETGEEPITLEKYTTVEPEQLGLGESEQFYILKLRYDKDSEEVLEEDFKLNIYLKAIQEEEVI